MVLTAVNPMEQFRKAQDSKRKSDLAQIQRALEAYYQDFGRYPAHTVEGTNPFTINLGTGAENDAIVWGSTWSPYLDILPADPNSSKFYTYWSGDTGNQSYRLYASFDRGSRDPDTCAGGNMCPGVPLQHGTSDPITCGLDAEVCNYGVTSPNISP